MSGEHVWCDERDLLHGGSSPRERGAPDTATVDDETQGIIPA